MPSSTTTATLSKRSDINTSMAAVQDGRLPEKLDAAFLGNFAKLSPEQAGHLRHIHNLASQNDGEWQHMGSQEPGQEWLDAYRYQLATMAYAAGITHYHRVPLLRSVFMSLMGKLIKKMLLRDVWGYWFLTSHSGKFVDPDLQELRKPWANPIVRENIMYSGHLLLMVSLFTMLFDDDRYNQEDGLLFNWNPIFWGMGPERFSYTRQSLQSAILENMERENWLGACCEPNSIFVVCNQFPLIAMRYNDVRDGTQVVDDVLKKYTEAWESKGMVQEDGLFVDWYSPRQDRKKQSIDIGFTAWAAAFMNAWNPSVAHDTFKNHADWFLSCVDEDHVAVNDMEVAVRIRELIQEGADPKLPSTLTRARQIVDSSNVPKMPGLPYSKPTFGYVVQWTSEVGDQRTLDGLLSYADQHFSPTWERGGLYYPSRKVGELEAVDVFTGNSAIAYARLNVFDGQRKMWTDPWTAEHFSKYPFVSNVGLESDVDFLRGSWNQELKALAVTMRSWDGETKQIRPRFHSLPKGQYGIYRNGDLCGVMEAKDQEDYFELDLMVSEELDIVLVQATTKPPA